MEGFACVEAEKHQPDEKRGGCTCGFCVWSVEHVVVMTVREVLDEVQRVLRNPVEFGDLREQINAQTVACEWCGRAIQQNGVGGWYAVKGVERGYDPLVCDAVADRDDTDHAPTPKGSSSTSDQAPGTTTKDQR